MLLAATHQALGSDKREIGHEAVWSLSTAKPGNGESSASRMFAVAGLTGIRRTRAST
jgi:hypothetical protein